MGLEGLEDMTGASLDLMGDMTVIGGHSDRGELGGGSGKLSSFSRGRRGAEARVSMGTAVEIRRPFRPTGAQAAELSILVVK